MQIKDRVVLITGGKRIGAVIATELAARGADIALAYARSREEAERTAGLVRSAGRRALVRQADVTKPIDCDALVADTVAELGRLDVLINMASVYRRKPFDELTPEDWDADLAVDLTGGISLRARGRAAHAQGRRRPHRQFRRLGGGQRAAALSRVTCPYYVAKAGVIALTEVLALELADDQILVNAIAPGPIVAPPGTTDEEMKSVEKATPLGRWGGELEIAKAVIGLIETDFITGETIRVDGGRHAEAK